MAYSFKQGMQLVDDFQGLRRRDFPVSGINLSGTATNPLCDGEFLSLDNNATQQLVRFSAADGTEATAAAARGLWAVSTEVGRYDIQAINKVTVLWTGAYEAIFRLWDLDDQANLVIGELVTIAASDNNWGNGTENKPVISSNGGAIAANAPRVGMVTQAPTAATAGSTMRVYVYAVPYYVA